MTFIRAAATALILLVSSCAARNEIVVRSSNGQGRSFECDAKNPAPDAPPGWQGWHADFDLHAPAGGVTGPLPPVLDFAIAWDGELKKLQVASRTGRGTIAVPAGAAVVRSHPELFGLAVAMGVVPRANDGVYLVE